ncbi:methyl-accepting chemotaxis protein [Natronobacterium gregoryi]|uniref:Methyl-accepting chemotaxis protein n=2 Tax=Natronobacterium gregoryi TaxID=44930 RepID=L0AM40_NATGS|nr:methyl-accepting chemotaxis protein [Natronobacterium gregoryi]AFZ74247.1 methyl-accepting chemotaxis protein [Natronobacterium gregoryi SP2]ELY63705.1 transducer protein cosT/halobacterial transducer protein IV [Natronobacterium gregoryi SP2]PLK21968.1 methyl-accepting chemotaxis protein [Natronobacterium gregoryi SP2]SFI52292.1 methyl-accepting chemotaxis protein [Natronobacterium gregoryi]
MSDENDPADGVVDRIRSSYLAKFALALLVIIVVISIAGVYVHGDAANTLDRDVEEGLTVEAEADAAQLGEWIESNELPTRLISDHPSFADEPDTVQEYLVREQESHLPARVETLRLVNTIDEVTLASTDDSHIGESVSDEPWITQTAFSGYDDVVTSEPYTDDDGSTVITFMSPVPQEPGWVLVMTVDASAVDENFDSSVEETFTEVIRATGGSTQVLFSNHADAGDGELGSYVPNATQRDIPELRDGLDGNSGFLEEATKQSELEDEHVAAYAPVEGSDWVVITHAPSENAYQLSSDIQRGILLFIGLALVGVVFVGGTIGRNTAKSITTLSERAERVRAGEYDVVLESDRRDELGTLYHSIDDMRTSMVDRIEESEEARKRAERKTEEAEQAKETAEAAQQEAEAARQSAEELLEHLQTKANAYRDAMEAAANGDLTRRVDSKSQNEAMEEIGTAYNEMIAEIDHMIGEVSEFAGAVAAESQDVTAGSQEVRDASERVAESVQEISDGASQQHDALQSAANELSGLSATTEEIAASSSEVVDLGKQTSEAAESGQKAASKAASEMDEIGESSEVAVSEIRDLEAEVAHVDELISQISTIADDTGLLALNANVQAARAEGNSNAGRGFSVVAQEVKELAGDTKAAADEVEQRLERIRAQTETSVETVEMTSERIDDAIDQVDDAVEELDQITQYADETNVGIQEIADATDDQAASLEAVSSMVDETATISEETTAEAENVAAAAEEQTSSMANVSDRTRQLAMQASELSERFNDLETTESDTE